MDDKVELLSSTMAALLQSETGVGVPVAAKSLGADGGDGGSTAQALRESQQQVAELTRQLDEVRSANARILQDQKDAEDIAAFMSMPHRDDSIQPMSTSDLGLDLNLAPVSEDGGGDGDVSPSMLQALESNAATAGAISTTTVRPKVAKKAPKSSKKPRGRRTSFATFSKQLNTQGQARRSLSLGFPNQRIGFIARGKRKLNHSTQDTQNRAFNARHKEPRVE